MHAKAPEKEKWTLCCMTHGYKTSGGVEAAVGPLQRPSLSLSVGKTQAGNPRIGIYSSNSSHGVQINGHISAQHIQAPHASPPYKIIFSRLVTKNKGRVRKSDTVMTEIRAVDWIFLAHLVTFLRTTSILCGHLLWHLLWNAAISISFCTDSERSATQNSAPILASKKRPQERGSEKGDFLCSACIQHYSLTTARL